MNRRAALGALLFAVSGCSRREQGAALPPRVRALLAAGHDFGDSTSAEEATAASELLRLTESVRSALRAPSAGPAAETLTHAVYATFGFVREVEDAALGFVLLPSVLRGRRGSCVGLGSLYLALAELSGISAAGVVLPGHFFVRVSEQGRARNVELLRQGEEMPNSWYRERYPVPGEHAPAYGRALSADEVLGVIEYDIGNQRRRQGRLQEARRAYQRATRHFPVFAEAQASLGAVLHLLGELEAAALAYGAAAQANPELPGLAANLALLQRERGVQ